MLLSIISFRDTQAFFLFQRVGVCVLLLLLLLLLTHIRPERHWHCERFSIRSIVILFDGGGGNGPHNPFHVNH